MFDDSDLIVRWQRSKAPKSVFISGTYDGMREYRMLVAKCIADAGHRPLEPSDAARIHEATCDFIRRQLNNKADFYIGIFGLCYGSRINGELDELSYTHFEYRLALKRWAKHNPPPPPMMTFRPEPGSAAYTELSEIAERANTRRTPEENERDCADQICFLEEVSCGTPAPSLTDFDDEFGPSLERRTVDRIVQTYCSRDELRAKVFTGMVWWKSDLMELAGDHLAKSREEQVGHTISIPEHLQNLLMPRTPMQLPAAMCIILQGSRSAKPHDVAAELRRINPWHVEEPSHQISLSSDRKPEVELLWDAVIDAVEGLIEDETERLNPDVVAEMIEHNEIPLMLGIEALHRLNLNDFATKFWTPLYDALTKRMRDYTNSTPFPRMLMIGSLQTSPSREIKAPLHVFDSRTKVDYAKPVLVPISATKSAQLSEERAATHVEKRDIA